MFKSKVPDIFGKNIQFLCILRSQFCLQYKKQIFSKTWQSLNFNLTLIMKFNLESRVFYSLPNVARFKIFF